MVQGNQGGKLIDSIVFLFFPEPEHPIFRALRSLWERVFPSSSAIRIATERRADTDALLTSVMRCDEYGCPAGSSDDTLGKMYIFDTWQFEPPNEFYPRYLISNAVWRKELPILTAIERRMEILAETLRDANERGRYNIRSITIEVGVLLVDDSPPEVQEAAIHVIKDKVAELFGLH